MIYLFKMKIFHSYVESPWITKLPNEWNHVYSSRLHILLQVNEWIASPIHQPRLKPIKRCNKHSTCFFPLAGYSIGYRFLSQGSRDGVCDKCHMKYISMSLLSVVNFHVVSFKQHESKCPKVKEWWMTPQPSARPDDLHQGARNEAR